MSKLEDKGRKTGLFFGSFNPVHIGHMALANYFIELTAINDLQFVLSPQNPLKSPNSLASENDRLKMLEVAVAAYSDLPISINTVELELPKPSYTVNTLNELKRQNPNTSYLVLMGADNLAAIEKWRDYQAILSEFEICVYPRMGYNTQELAKQYGVMAVGAPIIEVSSTFLRSVVAKGYNFSTFFPPGVLKYIKEHGLYSTS